MKKHTFTFAVALCVTFAALAVAATTGGPSTVMVNSATYALGFPNAAQFYAANPAPYWRGDPYAGVFLLGGATELWSGATARVTIQGYGTEHGLLVHTTGAQGMAVIGWSSTGAQAVKAIQDTHYTQAAIYGYRATTAYASRNDAPMMVLKQSGDADYLQFVDLSGNTLSAVDAAGAVHPPHISDASAQRDSIYFSSSTTQLTYMDAGGNATGIGNLHPPHVVDAQANNDSLYLSTNSGKLTYKDSAGSVHPLY